MAGRRNRQLTRGGYRGGIAAAGAAGYAITKWAPKVGGAFGKAYSNFKREAASAPNYTVDHAPTTYQHDVRTLYKRRRAPRRVRRRARRAAMSFQKNMSNLLGCKRLVQNLFSTQTAPAGSQLVLSSTYFTNLDMERLFNLFGYSGGPATPNDNTLPNLVTGSNPPTEFLIRNFRMEEEVVNTGTTLAYIDLYYFYPRKDLANDPSAYFSSAMVDGADTANAGTFNKTGSVLTLTNSVNTNVPGVTPFDVPAVTENIVIYKTRRIMLQPGQAFSFDLKLKPGNQSTKDWIGIYARRNISRGVFLFAQGVNNGTQTTAVSLGFHTQTWVSSYKQGGKGATCQTFIGTGQT